MIDFDVHIVELDTPVCATELAWFPTRIYEYVIAYDVTNRNNTELGSTHEQSPFNVANDLPKPFRTGKVSIKQKLFHFSGVYVFTHCLE